LSVPPPGAWAREPRGPGRRAARRRAPALALPDLGEAPARPGAAEPPRRRRALPRAPGAPLASLGGDSGESPGAGLARLARAPGLVALVRGGYPPRRAPVRRRDRDHPRRGPRPHAAPRRRLRLAVPGLRGALARAGE